MEEWDYNKAWYHGSPLELTKIRKGSTITQDSDLARVFSHKPTLVSISDDGMIKHNGKVPGFLYRIRDHIGPRDVYPHSRSSMEKGKEWLAKRELLVELIGPTQIVEEETLTDDEILRLGNIMKQKRKARSRDNE